MLWNQIGTKQSIQVTKKKPASIAQQKSPNNDKERMKDARSSLCILKEEVETIEHNEHYCVNEVKSKKIGEERLWYVEAPQQAG